MSIFFQSPDWNPLLSPPAAQRPYVYKLDGRLGMAGPPVGPLGIDEEKRTADFIISTNERDRGGDEMVVAGCDLSEYRINPVVLLGHRQVMPGQPDRPLPVGVATDPAGALRVWVDSQGRLLSRCHFHEDTDEAREAWLGVRNGWLRGASIGFNPTVPPTPLPPVEGNMRTGYRFAGWKLLEWSLVITPMNASCVAIRPFLEAGKIEGRSITPMFRKALEFAAEPAPAWSPGWTPAVPAPNHLVLLRKALTQIPGIAAALVSGFKKGTLTMTAPASLTIKAFPPGEEDNPDAAQETEKPDASETNDTEKGGEAPAKPAENGVDLAQAISTLTMAIASIQEMIKPKEAPAPAPEPHREPDEDDMPREPADQPRQDARDQENAREALDRYRSGKPGVIKGWKQEYADCVTMAADHLDELGDMETGTKWSGSHRLACKTHAGMIRKMCKEMAEADASAGGATVPEGESDEPTPQEKQQVLSAVREALGPVSDAIYRLTGKRA